MNRGKKGPGWRPALAERADAPIYRAIADAMATDIGAGRLRPGDRLPPHRALADAIGVDLTTVTRAYAEAHRRGLTDATVGRGTFVRGGGHTATLPVRASTPAVDIEMNAPPQPQELTAMLGAAMARLLTRGDAGTLLTYRPTEGAPEDRAAGAAWLRPLLPDLAAERVLVAPGAQTALTALLATYVRPGETIVTEAVTYAGLRARAALADIRLAGVAMDAEGLLPDALDETCRRVKPRALYCIPTLHNPTTATMSQRRRQAIAAVARRHDLLVFEDDAYALLLDSPPSPLAALLPERSFYLATLSKTLLPALRIAYLVPPGPSHAVRLTATLRATAQMPSPLLASLATQWIGDGTATRILAKIRQESAARQRLAAKILPQGTTAAQPHGYHAWLRLPPAWTSAAFATHARRHGLAAMPADAFAVDASPPPAPAVRLALGAASSQDHLAHALRLAADALDQLPALLASAG